MSNDDNYDTYKIVVSLFVIFLPIFQPFFLHSFIRPRETISVVTPTSESIYQGPSIICGVKLIRTSESQTKEPRANYHICDQVTIILLLPLINIFIFKIIIIMTIIQQFPTFCFISANFVMLLWFTLVVVRRVAHHFCFDDKLSTPQNDVLCGHFAGNYFHYYLYRTLIGILLLLLLRHG